MAKSKHVYRHSDSQMQFILNSISDRLDKLESLRGTSTVSGNMDVSGTITSGGVSSEDLDLTGDTLDLSSTVLQGETPLVFEGATDDGFRCSLKITDPSTDRTITFPNNTGTVALTDAIQTITEDWTFDQNAMKVQDTNGTVLHQLGDTV